MRPIDSINWQPEPHVGLRQYGNGTIFALRKGERVEIYQLIGNLPKDESWKAQSLRTFKVVRLERHEMAQYFVLSKDCDLLTQTPPLPP